MRSLQRFWLVDIYARKFKKLSNNQSETLHGPLQSHVISIKFYGAFPFPESCAPPLTVEPSDTGYEIVFGEERIEPPHQGSWFSLAAFSFHSTSFISLLVSFHPITSQFFIDLSRWIPICQSARLVCSFPSILFYKRQFFSAVDTPRGIFVLCFFTFCVCLHLTRLFWNHTLIWCSVSPRYSDKWYLSRLFR